jgi:nucleoside-diphosphate-sugar epimerase
VKKALITGGAGFIGLSLARRLLSQDVAVDFVDNFSRGQRDAELAAVAANPHLRCMTLDLSVPGVTDALDKDYDAIFHFAAILGVANVIGRAYDTLKLNVELTNEALRLARRQADLKVFLFASTSEIYAGSLLAGLLSFPTPENSTIALPALEAPRTSYMLSKLYGEALVHHARVPGVIIRPHNVYGERMGAEHVVPELMKRMREAAPGSRLPIYSPTHSRTFCFIDDAVELTARLARNPEAIGRAWNVGTEAPEYSIMQVAEIVRRIVGADVELIQAEETAGSPTRRCPSMTKTNALTGHHRRVSLEEGVEVTYAWYSRHGFGK